MFSVTVLSLLLVCVTTTWCRVDLGSEEEYRLDKRESNNCVIPDLRPYEVNSTEEQMYHLLQEGRCLLICLEKVEYFYDFYTDEVVEKWRFTAFKDNSSCPTFINEVQECIRGCRIFLEDTTTRNCGDLPCPISQYGASGVWGDNKGCSLECKKYSSFRDDGCYRGYLVHDNFHDSNSYLTPRPVLQILNDTDQRGLYNVALGYHGRLSWYSYFYTGLLFQIKDLLSNNVTYIWQNNLNKPLNLSSYSCRTVNISLCLVDKANTTDFTEPIQLYIEGEEPYIPDAPIGIQIVAGVDENYFQHAVLNVSWQSPEDDTDLRHYLVNLRPDQSCNSSEIFTSQKILHENSTMDYFLVISSNITTKGIPMMGCSYLVEVAAVSNQGMNASSTWYTVKPLEEFKDELLTSFTCEKSLSIHEGTSSPTPYFIFTLNWTMANYFADVNAFSIDYLTYNIEDNVASGIQNVTFLNNLVTSYSTSYMTFSQPGQNPNEFFLFKLNVHWKQEDFQSYSYNCTLSSLSPAPSEVLNFEVNSLEAVSPKHINLNASWSAPEEVNGILSYYHLCLSKFPLNESDWSAENNASCLNVSSHKTSLNINLKYEFCSSYEHGYFQIRPVNTYAAGSWSKGYPVTIPRAPIDKFLVGVIFGSSLGFAVIIIVALSVIYYYCRRNRVFFKMQYSQYDMENVIPVQSVMAIDFKLKQKIYKEECTDKWELSRSQVKSVSELGHGEFGVVMKGFLHGHVFNGKVKASLREASCVQVAIKMLKDNASGIDQKNFLSEIEILKKVCDSPHPHVVSMLGYITTQEPLCLVTEFAEHGDLRSFLLNVKKIHQEFSKELCFTLTDLVNFFYQIADGMEFISSKGVVHCDLACRNILVAEGKVLKITDFGLSHEVGMGTESKVRTLSPIRWMPIEFIEERELTLSLDVWSFGVVLWEIATVGRTPYSEIDNHSLLSFLKRGNRLEKPESISSEIYEIMQSCWSEEITKRPRFTFLKNTFSKILLSQRNDNYYVILDDVASLDTRQEQLKISKSISLSTIHNKQNLVHLKSSVSDVDLQGTLKSERRRHGIL